MNPRTTYALVALTLLASTALAEPRLQIGEVNGVPQVELVGEYGQSHYTVSRADARTGPWRPVGNFDLLCLDRCIVDDPGAVPGHTYWYRFDVETAGGGTLALGPYEGTIPPSLARSTGARAVPNPTRGATQVELHLAGSLLDSRLPVEARVLDVQGRQVRALFSGSLPRGLSNISWDGLDDSGRPVGPGVYLVRLQSPLGVTTTRLTRLR